MKKILILGTALFLVTGVTFADGKKKKAAKAKKSCCVKTSSCGSKAKTSTVKL